MRLARSLSSSFWRACQSSALTAGLAHDFDRGDSLHNREATIFPAATMIPSGNRQSAGIRVTTLD